LTRGSRRWRWPRPLHRLPRGARRWRRNPAEGRIPGPNQNENHCRKSGPSHCIILLGNCSGWYDAEHAPPDVCPQSPGEDKNGEPAKFAGANRRAAPPSRTMPQTMPRTMAQKMARTIRAAAYAALLLGLSAAAGTSARAQSQATPAPAPAPPSQDRAQQQAVPPADTRSRMVVESRLVLVPVTVKDKDGHLVGGLEKEDFRVFADGVEQQILLFTSDPFPLSAVVVIDNDLSQRSAGQVQKSLVSISAGFGPDDEVAVMTYGEFPHTVSDFSSNNDLLFTQLKRLELGSHSTLVSPDAADPASYGAPIPGRSDPNALGMPIHGVGRPQVSNALNDAVYAAGDMLKGRGRGRRKIVFLISDGSDSKRDTHGFDETLHTLLAADVSVYSISVSHLIPAAIPSMPPRTKISTAFIPTSPNRRAISTLSLSLPVWPIAPRIFTPSKCAFAAPI
jgi:VWFA-related protein